MCSPTNRYAAECLLWRRLSRNAKQNEWLSIEEFRDGVRGLYASQDADHLASEAVRRCSMCVCVCVCITYTHTHVCVCVCTLHIHIYIERVCVCERER